MNEDIKQNYNNAEGSPSPFKSWKAWYAIVLGNLVFLIILFYIFTKVFQ